MTRGNERDEAAGPVEALHDAYAQALYRYAWSLLGGGTPGAPQDPVTEAVHEGFVAGVVLEKKLRDPADRGPWLYALVRAACQRRGFAHTCPYTRLATVPAETPVARMFSRLPASHRELVELNLRHMLPSSAVARVLGLEPRICDELSRSAIRRAAEGLNRLSEQDDSEESEESAAPNRRDQIQQVSSALALLRPPGAPPGLRERVVRTCLAPEAAGERRRIAAAMEPLAEDGYPVHRARVTGVFPIEDEDVDETLVPMPATTPRPLPDDRITTRDQPLHENTRAPLPAPERRRWPLPAVSGLATVAVALGLWWWAGMAGAPPTMIDAGPAETGRGHDGSKVETVSTASENKPGVDPSPEVESVPATPSPESTTGTAPESNGPGDAADPEDGQGPEDDPGQAPEPEPGSPQTPEEEDDTAPTTPPEDDEAPGEEPGGEEPDGGSGGLLGGLFGLLFGEE
ncbi:RNA polymerase sigma factor [Nocardiopsis listeri]|uniref:RNA polymerase sigma factor n=1 Tax=Nocardiopsis listeri TaxID=53440 RepID=UPI00082B3563|nr:hypothetical protein [Nocardiopsis listeri]